MENNTSESFILWNLFMLKVCVVNKFTRHFICQICCHLPLYWLKLLLSRWRLLQSLVDGSFKIWNSGSPLWPIIWYIDKFSAEYTIVLGFTSLRSHSNFGLILNQLTLLINFYSQWNHKKTQVLIHFSPMSHFYIPWTR